MFSLLPISKINAEDSNVGFVQGNIWYSQNEVQEGDAIKIYTVVFNPDTRELSGNIIFFDNNIFLGKKSFTVPANGVKEVYIDWTATIGTHTIFAKIENAKFLTATRKYEDIYLANNESEKSSLSVSKKIIPEVKKEETDTTKEESSENPNLELVKKIIDTTIVENIGNTIKEKTPDFIAQPVISTTNKLETFRKNTSLASNDKKDTLKNEIEILNNTKKTDEKVNDDKLLKPFKYAQLFFFTLSSFVFEKKFLFYAIFAILVFFILRFIWRKIF